MKPIDPGCARRLANCLTQQNAAGASWRALGREYDIAAGTLNRFAKSGGEWVPKSRKILKALGLIEPEPERTPIQKAIDRLAWRTANAVVRRKKSRIKYPAVEKSYAKEKE